MAEGYWEIKSDFIAHSFSVFHMFSSILNKKGVVTNKNRFGLKIETRTKKKSLLILNTSNEIINE